MTFLSQVRKAALERPSLQLFRDYLSVAKNEGTTQDILTYIEDVKQLITKSVTATAPSTATTQSDLTEYMLLQKRALLIAAPQHFDSYLQYVEWDREPKRSFYLPRRKQLLPIVNALQDLADDKLDLLCVSQAPGTGKLVENDTKVFTRQGWKKHGDLVVGDEVVGLDGKYKKVLHVFPKDMADYEVTFTNGEVIRCHGNHEWVVYDRHRPDWKHPIIKTTKQMASVKLDTGTPGKRGHRYFYQLPLAMPVEGDVLDLPVDPYVLGMWLGDGTTTKPAITIGNRDRVLVYEMAKRGYHIRHIYEQIGCKRYEFYKLGDDLHKLGLCNYHHTIPKFIPEMYLRASIQQRLALLAGLIDTDGTKDRATRYTYSTTSENLRDSVCQLISSFGWRYSMSLEHPKMSSSGILGRKVVYIISFTPDLKIPCRVPRKKIHVGGLQRRVSISSIKPIEPREGNCIQVEGGIYRVGETMIPTHNSTMAIFYMTWLAGRNPDAPILGASHSNAFIRGVYDECLRILDAHGEYLWHDVFPTQSVSSTNAKDCRIDIGRRKRFETLEFTSIGTGNAGLYRAVQLLYCDDLVSGLEVALSKERLDKLWEVYTTDLRQRKMSKCKELHIATRWSVHDVIGRLEERYHNDPRARFIVIPALNEADESNFDYLYGVGFTTEAYHQQREIMDDVSWKALYMNQPVEREGLLYPEDELQRFFDLPDTPPDAILAACDTKDRGSDYCVMPIVYQYGRNYYVADIVCSDAAPEVVDELLIQALLQHKVQMARFESNSAGGRVAKTVQEAVKKRGGITKITTKYTVKNKETKILMASPFVKERFFFLDPSKQSRTYQAAMRMITSYTLAGRNKHDDTVDALAQLAEFVQSFDVSHLEVIQRPW